MSIAGEKVHPAGLPTGWASTDCVPPTPRSTDTELPHADRWCPAGFEFSEYCSHAENYKRPLYRGTKKSDALVRWTPRNGTWPPLAGKEKKPTVGGSGL